MIYVIINGTKRSEEVQVKKELSGNTLNRLITQSHIHLDIR